MQRIITDNLPQIIDVCKTHHVKALYVFGSAVRDDFNDDSDVDFMAEFVLDRDPENIESLRLFYDNMDALQDTLSKILNREVDLLMEASVKNKYRRYFMNEEKKMLYAAA